MKSEANWTVNAASPAHVARIANRMRSMDRLEVSACGHTPKGALRSGLRASSLAWTIMRDGEPVAMLGVVPESVIDRTGLVWMLGTTEIDGAARAFVSMARPVLDWMRDEYPRLFNICAVENVKAIRLLRWLGFAFDDEVVYVGGVPFRRFSIGPD